MNTFFFSSLRWLPLTFLCLISGCDRPPSLVVKSPETTAPPQPTPAPPQAEAVAHIDAEMSTHWTELGDSWFTVNSYGMDQMKNVSHRIELVPVTEIDRLNGTEMIGRVTYEAKACRSHNANGWSPWQPAMPMASYNFKKVNGKWEYDGLWYMAQGPLGGTYMAPSLETINSALR